MSARTDGSARPVALVVIGAIELLETLALVAFAALLISTGPGSPYPMTAYGAGGTVLILAVLLGAVGIGTLRRSPWTRTAGLVWHVVQILIGLYALTGDGPVVQFAAAVIAPAVAAIVLLLTRPVALALSRF